MNSTALGKNSIPEQIRIDCRWKMGASLSGNSCHHNKSAIKLFGVEVVRDRSVLRLIHTYCLSIMHIMATADESYVLEKH